MEVNLGLVKLGLKNDSVAVQSLFGRFDYGSRLRQGTIREVTGTIHRLGPYR